MLEPLDTEAPENGLELKEDMMDKRVEDECCYENTVFIGEDSLLWIPVRRSDLLTIVIDIMILVKDRLKAVPVDTFGEHVQRMHADRDKWFEQEYNVREMNAPHSICEIEGACGWKWV